MRNHLKRLLLGAIPLAVFVYPFLFGSFVYAVLSVLRVRSRAEIAIFFGYASLILLPCYILGSAFLTIKNPKTRQSTQMLPRNGLKATEIIEVWKKCLDVQMHFNGIALQIRNYAVTLFVAVIGAAAYAFKEHLAVELIGHRFSMAIAIFPAGIMGWSAFYFMDRLWYHRLLLGAVYQTLRLEKLVSPELELSHAIGDESPVPIWGKQIHSTQKIDLFYAAGLTFLILFTGLVLWQGAVSNAGQTANSQPQVQSSEAHSSPQFDKQQLSPPKERMEQQEQKSTQEKAPQRK